MSSSMKDVAEEKIKEAIRTGYVKLRDPEGHEHYIKIDSAQYVSLLRLAFKAPDEQTDEEESLIPEGLAL